MIALYVSDELSFETIHQNKNRIYRGYVELNMGSPLYAGVSPLGMGPTLVNDYTEFSAQTRFIPAGNEVTVRLEDQMYTEKGFWFADSTFYDVFSFQFLIGTPTEALVAPNSLVIDQRTAEKWFGSADSAFQKTLRINNSSYSITGVTANPEGQTEVEYIGLISLSTWPQSAMDVYLSDWYRLSSFTYILAQNEVENQRLNEIMNDFMKRYIEPFEESNGLSNHSTYELIPLQKLHFFNEAEYDHPKGNMSYLIIFSMVGIFILVIASINFVNLTLARSGKRSKEVGIRKTLGANKRDIRLQFLAESMLVALFATLLGLAALELFLPSFNNLTDKSFSINSILNSKMLIGIGVLWIITGLLSGFYPAFVLSLFDPVRVLKGGLVRIGSFGILRKFLIGIQFVFSILMMIGTITVFEQMHFMQNKNLGIEAEHVIVLELPKDSTSIKQGNTIRNELLNVKGVEQVSLASNLPGRTPGELLFRIEKEGTLVQQGIKFMTVDEHFFETMGIEFISGRNFRKEGGTDSQSAFIINQTAAQKFGWENEPLGKRVQWGLYANDSAASDGHVVGVVNDFHFQSLHNPIEPIVFLFQSNNSQMITMRINANNIAQTVSKIEEVWQRFGGGKAFDWHFLDSEFDGMYKKEQKMLKVFGYFTFVSILIALMGLFATASFTVQQRTKEIGIRKILGANLTQLIELIAKEFLGVVVIANIISIPIAYFALSKWLTAFAYRLDLHFLYFLTPAVVSLLFTLLIVGFHCWKANNNNPVNAIHYE
jgi:putative ABC transport system permease protein